MSFQTIVAEPSEYVFVADGTMLPDIVPPVSGRYEAVSRAQVFAAVFVRIPAVPVRAAIDVRSPSSG
jgi:hypothetical protein